MPQSRRAFLRQSTLMAGAAGMWSGGTARAATSDKAGTGANAPTVLLGGPVFVKTEDPDELARASRDLGYTAAYCPSASLSDPGRLRAIEEAFWKHRIVIAEVGRWVNLMDADPERRAANLKTVKEGLAIADAVGALCCVDIAGSLSKEAWYGPAPGNLSRDFFDAAVENARTIIDEVQPRRAKFCYEMMGWAYPDSVESMLKMLRAVGRKSFGVHLDPCNLINSPGRFYDNTALLNDCFDKLGKHIVSCHAKDLRWEVEMNLHFVEVRPGSGALDYRTYLNRLARLPQRPPLMLEHLPNAEEYAKARDYILGVGREEGLSFAGGRPPA